MAGCNGSAVTLCFNKGRVVRGKGRILMVCRKEFQKKGGKGQGKGYIKRVLRL